MAEVVANPITSTADGAAATSHETPAPSGRRSGGGSRSMGAEAQGLEAHGY